MLRAICRWMVLMVLAVSSTVVSAAWWEFGRAEGEPVITDLKFNRVDVLRAEDLVVLNREDLDASGVLTLRGQAEVRRGLIGLVEVSLDGGETWQRAVLGERGRFTFEFRPTLEQAYDFRIRAITTVGQKTDVEDHSFTLRISAANVQEEVRQAFMNLLQAYMDENRSRFLAGVSQDFDGNLSVLEDAISDDFRYLDNIRIEANIARVAQFDRSHEVYFTFNRRVQSARSGQILRDSAASMATFVREGDGFKLQRLAAPLIFGLSGASEIATSVTEQSVGRQVITVDPRTGSAATAPQGSTVGQGGGQGTDGGNVERGSAMLYASNDQCTAFEFDGGNTYPGQNCLGAFTEGDFRIEINLMWLQTGNMAQRLNASFDATSQVPATGYQSGPFDVEVGQVWAFSLLGGSKFGVIEITSMTEITPGLFHVGIRYKFQPDGSRNF